MIPSGGKKSGLGAFVAAWFAILPTYAQAQGAIEAWVQHCSGPGNRQMPSVLMALDAGGNVCLAGPSYNGDPLNGGSHDDWTTIKYSSAGMPLWSNFYNGPGNNSDTPRALALDASGNVFVTGMTWGPPPSYLPSCVTIKYSSDGAALWTRSVESWFTGGRALTLDRSGNVVVTSDSHNGANTDFLTIKYSSDGVALWTKRYNGPGNGNDWPLALATDADGNVVVLGNARSASGDDSTVIINYSSAGVPRWTRLYPGMGCEGSPLALDRGGNVLVAGRAGRDYATIKYSSTGVPVWTNRYDGPVRGTEYAYSVAVDAIDNVYVTGESEVSGTIADYATIKYTGSGVPVWTNLYNGPGNWIDSARALAVDANGNVVVTGGSFYSGGQNAAWGTVAYSSSGVPLWTKLYNGPGNYIDWGQAVALDTTGSVYVAGSSQGSDGDSDLVLVKYLIPPFVGRQPLSCTNAVGTTASFSVEAVGGLPLSYQWRKGDADLADGGNIAGVTTTNLLIANVQLADAGGYSVLVTNAYGTATSAVAQFTVVVPPSGGQLTNLTYSPATGLSFIFRDGTVGQPYRIQRSASLAEENWVDWQSFTYHEPLGLMDVGAAGAEWRFYRAISP